nr:hypothetical protein Iba_chr11aCG7430 [Ipomoea batatas]
MPRMIRGHGRGGNDFGMRDDAEINERRKISHGNGSLIKLVTKSRDSTEDFPASNAGMQSRSGMCSPLAASQSFVIMINFITKAITFERYSTDHGYNYAQAQGFIKGGRVGWASGFRYAAVLVWREWKQGEKNSIISYVRGRGVR